MSNPDLPTTSTVLAVEADMLVQIRDTLYEGDWDDFVADLTARLEGRAHVFQTVGASPDMKATIARHLKIIAQLRREESHAEARRRQGKGE